MIDFVAPQLLVVSTLLIGLVNLITPFSTKEDSKIRSAFLLFVSISFLSNVLLLDYLFLNGIQASFMLLDLGKYNIALHLEPLGMVFLTLLAILWICALPYTIKFLDINEIKSSSRFLFFVNC